MNLRAVLAEALGTFVLVVTGSLAAVSANAIGSSLGGLNTFVVLLTVPFGFGFGLLAAITIFGHVSGGHFNPAVSLAAMLDGRIGWQDAIFYAIAQVIGAVAAAYAIFFVVAQGAVSATVNQPSVPDVQAFAGEVILTTIFVAVILTVTRREPSLAPLVIALTLVMIHFAGIPITGASVNPARSLGPAIVAGNYDKLWIYLTAPFVGGILGWAIARFVTIDEDEDEPEFEDEDEPDMDEAPAR